MHIDDVVADLEGEAAKFERDSGKRTEGVAGALNDFGPNMMQPDNDLIDKGLKRALRTLEFASEARIRRLACSLLPDLAANHIAPLARAMSAGLGQLRVDEPRAGVETIISTWPRQDIIPPTTFPAQNERLIEPVTTYPEAYRRGLQSTTGEELRDRAERVAVGEILVAATEPTPRVSFLVAQEQWWPQALPGN
jgi:hypothetical protein